MSTWVLVLMLAIGGRSVAVEQIDGFQTRDACEREGAAVIEMWRGDTLTKRGGLFHCVEIRWEDTE